MTEAIQELISSALETLGLPQAKFVVEPTADFSHGDLATNVSLVVSKEAKMKPRDVAEKIVAEIEKNKPKEIEKIEIAGPGFINFFLSKDFLKDEVCKVLKERENYGRSEAGKGKKVLVEYSSPNIAKPFGVGHLRSTIIGDAIANLYKASGFSVIRDNHIGDWGTQFGKQICAIKHWGNEDEIANAELPVTKLVELYVKFHDEAEKNPALEDEARAWFLKLEQGDPEARRLWQKCIEWSKVEFDRIYKRLGITFDTQIGESAFEEKMKEAIALVKEKGLAKVSEGATLIFFPEEKLPPFMILKSDGSTLYATRDLATDLDRKEKYGPDITIVNEVGVDQSLHFKQLYEAEEMLGIFPKSQRVHVAHGYFRLPGGKMSTRKGNLVLLDDVLNEAVARARELNPETAEAVGVGAIKINDLKRTPHQDIIFNWEEILNLKGDSGPYLQYTFARAKAVIEKAKAEGIVMATSPEDFLVGENIIRMVSRFDGVIDRARREHSPNILVLYLFELASLFNAFYGSEKILGMPDSSARVLLCEITAQVLSNGLALLGVVAPERM